jgi:hypothetical protein
MRLGDTQNPQNNEDQGDHQQGMNDVARGGNAGINTRAKITKQPEDEQNYDNGC